MLLVNFNKSYIGWTGETKGIFNLVSTISYFDNSNKKVLFGLGQSVLAGNVYSNENLIKVPYYLFQVFGNSKKQKILRTDLPNIKLSNLELYKKRNKINDNNLSNNFKKFKLNIKKQKSLKLKLFEDIYKKFEYNNFASRIKFSKFSNLNFEIQFPVNHINISHAKKKWQVETGPILLPFISKKNKLDFLPSFIVFNSFDSIDIFYDYPFGFRNEKKNHIKNVSCEIELYFQENSS